MEEGIAPPPSFIEEAVEKFCRDCFAPISAARGPIVITRGRTFIQPWLKSACGGKLTDCSRVSIGGQPTLVHVRRDFSPCSLVGRSQKPLATITGSYSAK